MYPYHPSHTTNAISRTHFTSYLPTVWSDLLSNTTIWWWDIYTIYYIDNNYMFRHFSLAIFRLINEKLSKQLYSTCVYCIQGEVRGEVGTRSGMCCVGWVVWVQGFWYYTLF